MRNSIGIIIVLGFLLVITLLFIPHIKLIGIDNNVLGGDDYLLNHLQEIEETDELGNGFIGNPYFLIRNSTGTDIFKVEHTGNVIIDAEVNVTNNNLTEVNCIVFSNGFMVGNCG